MERRHLEYFVAIVDHGGFTAASQALRIAQPSLSQVIKTLERELGVELFQRLRTGARLTSAGEALIGPARQVLRDFDAARSAVSSSSGVVGGRLDIAATTGLTTGVLPELVGEFPPPLPGRRDPGDRPGYLRRREPRPLARGRSRSQLLRPASR
jgi:LysR family carnitine catabolism transcriptional activator